jgi:hypothetical protein
MFRLLKAILRLNIKKHILYIQPKDSLQESKHVALNYSKWLLIKVVLDSIDYYFMYQIITQRGCLAFPKELNP